MSVVGTTLTFLLQADRLVSVGQSWDSTSYQLSVTVPEGTDPATAHPEIEVIVNGDHAFVAARDQGSKVYHLNLSTDEVTVVDSDGRLIEYAGGNGSVGQLIGVTNPLRLTSTGDMYFGQGVKDGYTTANLYIRPLGSSAPVIYPLASAGEKIVGDVYVQRDKNSGTFYASGLIEVQTGENTFENREAMWKLVGGVSTSILKPGPGPKAASYGAGDSATAHPLQMPDGTITAVVDRSVATLQEFGLELRTFQSEFG
jgi:hypothetical protein